MQIKEDNYKKILQNLTEKIYSAKENSSGSSFLSAWISAILLADTVCRGEEKAVFEEKDWKETKEQIAKIWKRKDMVSGKDTFSDGSPVCDIVIAMALSRKDRKDKAHWIKKLQEAYEELILMEMEVKEAESKEAEVIEENQRNSLCEAELAALLLSAAHFATKPDEKTAPLVERMKQMCQFREELVGNALLATSYYGLEELQMRLPRLEETMTNPFGRGKNLQILTGTIMMADGGPAEGAKAIQFYLSLMKRGIDGNQEAVLRMLGLLAVIATNAKVLAEHIFMIAEELKQWELPEKMQGTETEWFLAASAYWIHKVSHTEEELERLNLTAMGMLTEMRDEVKLLLAAVCL